MQEQNRIYPLDTLPPADRLQIEILRKIGLPGRMEMTFQLSDNIRGIARDGIRQRHPDYTPRQITEALLRLTLDETVFRKIFPHSEVIE